MKWGIISRNVSALSDARREQHQRVNPPEVEQIVRLLEYVNNHRYSLLITVAIMTGMPQGELLALRWEPMLISLSASSRSR